MAEEVIKIVNVYKNYFISDGIVQYVLKDVNCEVYKGDFTAIMGPSGSGKSTFMNILGCLDQPTSGEYFLNGEDVARLDKVQLARIRNKYLGFVFQGFNLLSRRTIFDNITIPMIYANSSYRDRRYRAEEMLEKVGLRNYIDHFPTQLSGGMQQRVAIARALINKPTVIFADEPTGNLDTKTSVEIMNIFQDLNKSLDITIVMVTHEPNIASFTKKLIYIKDGVKEYDIATTEALEYKLI